MVLTNDEMKNHRKEEFLVILGISESFQNGNFCMREAEIG